jgi:Lrp/AsnC family transcriptional regulator
LDLIDRKIIHALQADATLSLAQLSDRVGLSQTPCWKRIRKLERTGVIRRRVALVDPRALDLELSVFVTVTTESHSPEWRDAFESALGAMPEVMEVHRLAGDVDYLIRVAAKNMSAYDAFYRRVTTEFAPRQVAARFAMETVKHTTAYPVDLSPRRA